MLENQARYLVQKLIMKGHRWFNVYSMSLDSKELKEIIQEKIRHAYVEKYIQKPFIDDEKLAVLYDLYDEADFSIDVKKRFMTTTMLVQTALDTHEMIPREESDHMPDTEKQLSVLAGDYYSGLYYFLLSEIEEIHMIRLLAGAIKQINEYKMKVYYSESVSLKELMDDLQQIESLLFTRTAESLGYDRTYMQMIESALLVNRLHQELSLLEASESSVIQYYIRHHELDVNAQDVIREEISHQKCKLDRLLASAPYAFEKIEFMQQPYHLVYNTTLAEEG